MNGPRAAAEVCCAHIRRAIDHRVDRGVVAGIDARGIRGLGRAEKLQPPAAKLAINITWVRTRAVYPRRFARREFRVCSRRDVTHSRKRTLGHGRRRRDHGPRHRAGPAAMGAEVRLYDALHGAAGRGSKIRKNLDKGVERGKVSRRARRGARARCAAFDDLDAACADTDCVIEAVPEEHRAQARDLRPVDDAAPDARAARDEHVVAADRARSRRRVRDPAPARRHALLQPRARDEARRGRASRERRATSGRARGRARRAHRQDADRRHRHARASPRAGSAS